MDLPRIGNQARPRLFARHIVLPARLYSRVVEIEERLSAPGEVLRALDLEDTEARLAALHVAGFRSLAVVLLHAYEAVGDFARKIGFTSVSLSHEVSPLSRVVPRGGKALLAGPLRARRSLRLPRPPEKTEARLTRRSATVARAWRYMRQTWVCRAFRADSR